MNSRDRVPLTVIVVLILIAALAALLAPFVLASPGPPGTVRDTLGTPPPPPVPSDPAVEDRIRVRVAAGPGALDRTEERGSSAGW